MPLKWALNMLKQDAVRRWFNNYLVLRLLIKYYQVLYSLLSPTDGHFFAHESYSPHRFTVWWHRISLHFHKNWVQHKGIQKSCACGLKICDSNLISVRKSGPPFLPYFLLTNRRRPFISNKPPEGATVPISCPTTDDITNPCGLMTCEVPLISRVVTRHC